MGVTGRIVFAFAVLAAALATAAAPPQRAKKAAPAPDKATAQAKELIQSCNAHKFETVVHQVVDGQPRQSKVTLCGKEGQSDADWIETLKDAINKVSANNQMAQAIRDQIVAALTAEIERLQKPVPLLPGRSTAKNSVLDGLSPLPPLPQGKPAQTAVLPPPRQLAPAAPRDEYAALPPLPTAPPPPPRVLAGGPGASLPLLPAPKLTLSCYEPGTADGPCTGFTRETMITVRADEDLPTGTSLRFVRDGDPKADVALAQLKKGRSVRLSLPTDVCLHAVGGRFEVKIVRSGQEVGSEGPFNLTC
jgi:hypothetical protein